VIRKAPHSERLSLALMKVHMLGHLRLDIAKVTDWGNPKLDLSMESNWEMLKETESVS